MKRKWIKYTVLLALLAALGVFIALGLDARLLVMRYEIPSEKIQSPLRLALVTDLHCTPYGEKESELLSAIDEQEPDVVLLGGDIFDKRRPDRAAKALLQGVSEKYPCYFVTGNHEYLTGRADELVELVKGYGIEVLSGERARFTVRGQSVDICGVTDSIITRYEARSPGIARQLANMPEGEEGVFSLLLSHRPEYTELYLDGGFDLVLSGHAHGGQWRLPGVLNGLYAPSQGFLPTYAGGIYEFVRQYEPYSDETRRPFWRNWFPEDLEDPDMVMIVSRGLARGTNMFPRFFNRPELVVVDLVPEENE